MEKKMTKDEIIIQAIVDAAKKLIQQYGLNKTTMEDVAKGAGKGKSTLYYYFKSKEEIFDEVIKQEMDDFFGQVKKAVDKEIDAHDKLKTYIVVKIKTLKNKISLYRFSIEHDPHIVNINEQFSKLRDRYDNAEIELISSILKLGVKDKLFKIPDNNSIKVLSELMVTCIRGIEMEVITKNKYSSLANQADLLANIITKGLN
ncbi:MAG: TetR/AcrR family transcriptional regulator [Sphingobacteriaceae bacterium]|nr:TetR/AcrR family transcriptional regulator [Sphingobacteriaceae bacterium]MBK7819291.1 TetR/AcrR family transcriptional regulator [Sphingobacteriaceae bacterium]